MIKNRFLTFFIILSIVSTSFLPPFVPRAQAFLGIGDIVVDVEAWAREIADGFAMIAAQKLVDSMVQSSITWANNGFEGGPAFVTDPGQYLTNIANQAAGNYINSSSVGFLCSPIQGPQIKIALANYYNYTYNNQFNNSCTLTGVVGNIENFYQDFNNGGWDTWFSMTQTETNNPYGAYLEARIQLDQRVASVLGVQSKKLEWSQGFKSKGDCLTYNPSAQAIIDYENGVSSPGTIASGDIPYDETQPADACIKYGPDKTPGSIIKGQLDKVLPSGLEKLITVNHVEQLVTAFTSGLLTKYVFGSNGLFSNNNVGGYTGSYPTVVIPPVVLCFASQQTAVVNQDPVSWKAVISNNVGGVNYQWNGDEVFGDPNPEVSVLYKTLGTKTMQVTISTTDSGGSPVVVGPISCQSVVNVVDVPVTNTASSTSP